MIEQEEKLTVSAEFDEDDKLIVSVGEQEVRRTPVKHAGVYKFNYENEEYHFIYEKTESTEKVYFYPLNAFKIRILNLLSEE